MQADEEKHLEEGPEDVGHGLAQRHRGDHQREEAVEYGRTDDLLIQ